MTHLPRAHDAGHILALFLTLAIAGSALACTGGAQNGTPPVEGNTKDAAPDVAEAPKAEPKAEPTSEAGAHEPAPGSIEVKAIAPKAPAIFFLAGLKGYTEPCGCTLDVLVGGIDRIVGYVDAARSEYDGSIFLDAGNLLFDEPELAPHRVAQERTKVDVLLEAQVALGTVSTTPGPNDFALGKHFYLDKVRGVGLQILAANIEESEGLPLGEGSAVHTVGEEKIALIGVVDPELFGEIEGLRFSDPIEAVKAEVKKLKKQKDVSSIVVVYHAKLAAAKALLEAVPEVHFVVVGHEPRETDAVDKVGNGYTLEAYDQGRYLGVLALYPRGGKPPVTFANGRQGSKAALDRITRRIEQVDAQIDRMPPATPGKEPEFLLTLRKQLAKLKLEREQLKTTSIELPKEGAAFVYRPIAMEPGYPLNAKLTAAREAFNAKLEELNTKNVEPIPPVKDGEPEYVGTEKCGGCHVAALEFWKKTPHARAVATLTTRNKLFDKSCIGCHVTGYRKPGGAVMGKLEYTANVNGTAFTKKLQDVGCESCHGPGSLHTGAPIGADAKPQHISLSVGAEVCTTCHNAEHSSRFEYTKYVNIITGEGHALQAAKKE